MSRISMAELMQTEFQPLQYVIPGIIPEGLTILAAPPKVGKSWLVLDLAYQLATGGEAMAAVPIDRARPVLYLALEDTPRRLQDRLKQLAVTEAPEDLYFQTEIPPGQVIAEATAFMEAHRDCAPVVIVDTLGKVAPPSSAGESDYQRDYRVGGNLKSVADCVPGGAVIVVHHTRKAGSDDFLDSVSGTQGLAGSADSILVLRRDRNENNGSLSVTSRDAVEGEYAVHRVGVAWTLAGGELTAAAIALAQKRITDGLGENSSRVVAIVNAHPEGVTPAQVSEALGLNKNTVNQTLIRCVSAERIRKGDRGLYLPLSEVSEPSEATPSDLTHLTLLTHVSDSYCAHGVTLGGRCSRCGGSAVAA